MSDRKFCFRCVPGLIAFGFIVLIAFLAISGCTGLSSMANGSGSGSGAGSGNSGGNSGSGGGSSGSGGGAANATFVYVAGAPQPGQGPNFAGFQIKSGTVGAVPGSPFKVGMGGAADATAYGNFVFTANDQIVTWRVDPATGSLKQVASTNFSGGLLAAGGPGKFLYLVGDAQVFVYTINADTGNLSQIPGSPFAVTELDGHSVISPDGKWICGHAFFQPGDFQIECDQLDPATGAVVTPKGQGIRGAEDVTAFAFTSEDFLIAGGGTSPDTNSFQVLQIMASGFKVLSSSPAKLPVAAAINPDNNFVVGSDQESQQINVYKFEPSTGSLTQVSQVVAPDREPGDVAFSPDGKNVAVAFDINNTLGVYSISPSGNLVPLTGSPIQAVPLPIKIAVPNPH